MEIRLLSGMGERPIGFVVVRGLNDCCNTNFYDGFQLNNRIQIYGDIKQDFSVCFSELKRKSCERGFLAHVDLAVRIHGVDVPIPRRRHIEFPIVRLVLWGDEEFETGCPP